MQPALATVDRRQTVELNLHDLKPYASLLVAYPTSSKKTRHLVASILESLPALLDEMLVERFVAEVRVRATARDRTPKWFGELARLLKVESEEAKNVGPVLDTLDKSLRGLPAESHRPPVEFRRNGRTRKPKAGSDLFSRVCDLTGLDAQAYRRRALMTVHPPVSEDGLEVGFLDYVEQRTPGWLTDPVGAPIDSVHQLVLVCRRLPPAPGAGYVGIYASEPTAKLRIARAIGNGSSKAARPLALLRRVDRSLLDAAFVRRDKPRPNRDSERRIRTLWLSGIHRSSPWKADAKMLAGPDLENALLPLNDQTYYFTAARCSVPVKRLRPTRRRGKRHALTVGVAPRRSSLWAGPVRDWEAFGVRVAELLDHIGSSGPARQRALSVLAKEVRVGKKEVSGAYDMSVICPELLAEEPRVDADLLEQAELWAYDAKFFQFKPCRPKGLDFTVRVAVRGAYVGALGLSFRQDNGAWKPTVTRLPDYKPPSKSVLAREAVELMVPTVDDDEYEAQEERRRALLTEAAAVCRRPRWLTVRYESGHTLAEGVFFAVRHRDVAFDRWEWAELSGKGFDVGQEKPVAESKDPKTGKPVLDKRTGKPRLKFFPDLIGKNNSLFCWVQKNWPIHTPGYPGGWLACDDGAGEIADFIHLDPNPADNLGSMVSLIHVKASGRTATNRKISTSDYEVVVGQAIKNLRSLDRINLADGLAEGAHKAVGAAVWLDGLPTTRKAMVRALRELGDDYRKQVVILQPRVTSVQRRKVRDAKEAGRETQAVKRMRQLDTLLVAAQAECRALEADLVVVGESTGAEPVP